MRVAGTLFLLTLFLAGSADCSFAQEEATVSDTDIQVLHFEELSYPTVAWVAHVQGVVVIRVVLDDRGNVVKAAAISGKEQLITDCLANAKKWKFHPNPQKMAVIVYKFTLPPVDCGSAKSFFTLEGANLANVTACPFTVQTAH